MSLVISRIQLNPIDTQGVVYSRWGSLTSPIASLSGVTSGVFSVPGGPIKIPAGSIPANAKVYVQADIRKVGANATASLNLYLGTAGNTTDPSLVGVTIAIGNNTDALVSSAARFGTSKTQYSTRTWAGEGTTSASSGNVLADRTTQVNTEADMFVTIGLAAASASDVFNLVGCTVKVGY